MGRVSKAVARVSSLSGESLGSAFAVSNERGLSAFHCVGDRRTGTLLEPRVRLSFGQSKEIEATISQFDHQLDVALLELAAPIPEMTVPLPLAGHVARHARFTIIGWPSMRPFIHDPFMASGRIVGTDVNIFNGVPAVQLYCEQAAGGTPLDGISGSPLIVGTTGGEAAIGVVRCSPDSSGHRDGGTVYATPVDAILRRWPELVSCQVSAVPVGHADYGVSYCTSPGDVSWGLWIAQILDDASMMVFTRQWYLRPGDDYVEVLRAGFASVRQIFVVVSDDYALDRDGLHLVEQKVISEHPSARLIPVMIQDAKPPEFLRKLHPLRLHGDLTDETMCRDLLLETLKPIALGRPISEFPFPGDSTRAMQAQTNWLNRIQAAGPGWESRSK